MRLPSLAEPSISSPNHPNLLESHIFRPSETHYRSLSTGDLASDEDFVEIQFKNTPTTSSLPSHFDDLDRVPMSFSRSGNVRLLSQTSPKAREIAKSGSVENIFENSKIEQLHRSQKWFFIDCEPKKAERILVSNGGEASFLVSYYKKQYILSILRGAQVQHLIIRQITKKNGNIAFQLDIDKSFKNLVDLVDYYSKNRGFILHSKLAKGVTKSIRSRA